MRTRRRAQDAREEQTTAQEAREEEKRAQKALAQEERRGEREVEAQEGHDREEEVATQEKFVEAKKEANSRHEENDVSNRHMTWWRDTWWVRVDNGPHLRTARGRRRVWRGATRPRGKRARQNGSQGEKGRNGSKGQRGEKKATPYTLSFTFQPQQQLQQHLQQQQQQRQRQSRRLGFNDVNVKDFALVQRDAAGAAPEQMNVFA